tara:strand:- start:11 stop:766 length:756 start_codon:yes stop_codon:yes gene_type:complete
MMQLWLDWHWASTYQHPAKLLRKFDRGHTDEERLKQYMRYAGIEVVDTDAATGKQIRFSVPGVKFLSGSIDGAIRGMPELPEDTWALWECKSMGPSTFKQLQKHGLEKANYKYWTQCHLYMHHSGGLRHCVFMAVNCDTQELYVEIFELDSEVAVDAVDIGKRILERWDVPPPKVAQNEAFFICKSFCSHKAVCHRGEPYAVNCRTCRFMKPDFEEEPDWHCRKHGVELNHDGQVEGCDSWEPITGKLNVL